MILRRTHVLVAVAALVVVAVIVLRPGGGNRTESVGPRQVNSLARFPGAVVPPEDPRDDANEPPSAQPPLHDSPHGLEEFLTALRWRRTEYVRKLLEKDKENAATGSQTKLAREFLTRYSNNFARSAVDCWWELGDELWVRFRWSF